MALTEADGVLFAELCAQVPVPWHGWTPALREVDRPVAVFVGDALDAATAAHLAELAGPTGSEARLLLSDVFIPVAAERHAHPALAVIAERMIAALSGMAGWPVWVLFLPGGAPGAPLRPFGAVPAVPVTDQQRQRGVARILVEAATFIIEQPEDAVAAAKGIAEMLNHAEQAHAQGKALPTARIADIVEAAAMAQADTLEGGFGMGADGTAALPRAAQCALVRFLIRRSLPEDAAPALMAQWERTLAAYASGALIDHLDGGVFAGSVDRAWCEPFMHKRTADAAALAEVFLLAHRAGGRDVHRQIGEHLLEWCVAQIDPAHGLPIYGWHAAAGGVDGAHLTWTRDQVAQVIGADGAAMIARRCGIDATPRMLHLRGDVRSGDAERLPILLHRLLMARNERPHPQGDRRADPVAAGMLLRALRLTDVLPDAATALRAACQRAIAVTHGARAHAALRSGLAAWSIAVDALSHGDHDAVCDCPGTAWEDSRDGDGVLGLLAQGDADLEQTQALLERAHAACGLWRGAPLAAASLATALVPAS